MIQLINNAIWFYQLPLISKFYLMLRRLQKINDAVFSLILNSFAPIYIAMVTTYFIVGIILRAINYTLAKIVIATQKAVLKMVPESIVQPVGRIIGLINSVAPIISIVSVALMIMFLSSLDSVIICMNIAEIYKYMLLQLLSVFVSAFLVAYTADLRRMLGIDDDFEENMREQLASTRVLSLFTLRYILIPLAPFFLYTDAINALSSFVQRRWTTLTALNGELAISESEQAFMERYIAMTLKFAEKHDRQVLNVYRKTSDFCHNTMTSVINYYNSRKPNLFEIAVDKVLQTGNFQDVYDALNRNHITDSQLSPEIIASNARLMWEISNCKYFKAGAVTHYRATDAQLEQVSNALGIKCNISLELPIVPVYIMVNNVKQYYDFFELLKHLTQLNHVGEYPNNDPTTRAPITSLEQIKYDHALHLSIQKSILRVCDGKSAIQSVDEVWQEVVNTNDIRSMIEHLKVFSTYVPAKDSQSRGSWLFQEPIKTQIDIMLKQPAPDIVMAQWLAATGKRCPITLQLIRYPVYFENNGRRHYFDLYYLLSWLQQSDQLPNIGIEVNFEEMRFDPQYHKEIINLYKNLPAGLARVKREMLFHAVQRRTQRESSGVDPAPGGPTLMGQNAQPQPRPDPR